jgi:hypothetical protein
MQPLAKLRDQIIFYFNLPELRNLAFDLGINHEELPGETLSDKGRELLAYCIRHGLLPALVRRCRELRPHAKWCNPNKKTLVLDPFCGVGGFLVDALSDKDF